jgi:hypothetical protein
MMPSKETVALLKQFEEMFIALEKVIESIEQEQERKIVSKVIYVFCEEFTEMIYKLGIEPTDISEKLRHYLVK